MTYYDEFGISRSANQEQIRKAHHALSRLLHPDLQTDPQLRQMAEIQMRRLNEMAATLLDPIRRRSYDAGLAGALVVVTSPQPQKPVSGGRGIRVFAGIVIAGVLLTGAILYLIAGDLIRVQTFQPVAAAHPQGPPEVEEAASLPAPDRPRATAPIPREVRSRYEGLWVYVASRKRGLPAVAEPDPEFIELRISDDRGFLHGSYRTRYRVPPQDMSSNFTFAGAATGDETSLALRAADGSEGTLDLRVAGPDTLQIDWNLNASTGSAVLARMVTP